jgi:hypothetical protein
MITFGTGEKTTRRVSGLASRVLSVPSLPGRCQTSLNRLVLKSIQRSEPWPLSRQGQSSEGAT